MSNNYILISVLTLMFSFHNFIIVTNFYLFVIKCVLHNRFIAESIDLKTAYALYENLKTSQKHLILIDNLYLLTLYLKSYLYFYILISQVVHVSYIIILFKIMELTESKMQVARLFGITEAVVNKLHDGIISKVSLLLNN